MPTLFQGIFNRAVSEFTRVFTPKRKHTYVMSVTLPQPTRQHFATTRRRYMRRLLLGGYKLKCDFCDYRARDRHRIAEHARVHRDEKPFACGMPTTGNPGNLCPRFGLLTTKKFPTWVF